MAQLNFKWGLHGNLPAVNAESVGTVYVTTDEQAMYVDVAADKRIRIQQIVTYATQADFTAALQGKQPPFGAEFYYVADANALMKWIPAAGEVAGYWKQINSTSELETAIDKIETILGDKYFAEDNTATVAGDIKALGDRIHSIETIGGQVNVIEGVKKNGTALEIDEEKHALLTLGALADKYTVATGDIADGAVTTAKIADGAVATAKIADKAVTEAKLDEALAAKVGKIATSEQAIATLRTDFEAADVTINDRIDDVEGRVEAIKNGYATDDDLATAVSTLEGKITEGDNAVKAIIGGEYSSTNTVATDIAGVKETLSGVSGKVNTIETNYVDKTAYAGDKTALEGGISEAKQAAQNAQNSANTANDLLDGYTGKGAVKTAIEGVAGSVSTLGQTVANHGTRLGTAEGKITNLETKVGAGLGDKTLTEAVTALQGLVDEDTSALRGDIDDLKEIVGSGEGLTKTDLTAQAVANAADIGTLNTAVSELKKDIGNLSNVMNFRGAFEADLDDDGEETFAHVNLDPAATDGDVIIVGVKEYVYSDGKWVEFGDASGCASAISGLEGRVSDNEADILALQTTVNSNNEKTGLVDRVGALETSQGTQDTTLADHKTRIEKLEAMLTWVAF